MTLAGRPGARTMHINGPEGGYRLGGYREQPAPPHLGRWVEVFWSFETTGNSQGGGGFTRHRVIPETGVSLCVISRRDGPGGMSDSALWLMGAVSRPRLYAPDPGVRIDAVRFKIEWCRDLLALDPADHEDAIDPAGGLPKGPLRALSRSWPAVRSADAIPRHLERWTEALVEPHRGSAAPAVHRLLESVRRRPAGPLGLATRAAGVGASERHLRRQVREATGHGPKHFQRIRRLQLAVSLADAEGLPRWSRVAASAGYADQAHLIHEVRSLTGVTPGALHAERRTQRADPGGRFLQSPEFVPA